MQINLFDIQDGNVVINHNCLSIPELKAVHDTYKNPIPAFNFLHYLYNPKSPYQNSPEDEKEDLVLADYPGEYSTEDKVMIAAKEKIISFYHSPTYQYYLDNKSLMERIGKFIKNAPISTGRDGSLTALQTQLKSVGKTILEFKQLEKTVLQELEEAKGSIRGNKVLAYDQQ